MTNNISDFQFIQKVSDQLRAYGLNPLHWVAQQPQSRAEITWQHRSDQDLRIKGRLLAEKILDLEFLFPDEPSSVSA